MYTMIFTQVLFTTVYKRNKPNRIDNKLLESTTDGLTAVSGFLLYSKEMPTTSVRVWQILRQML